MPHCASDHSLPFAYPSHQTHLLDASLPSPSSPVMPSDWPGGAALGQDGIPSWDWKITPVQGLWPGGLGRDQNKVGEMVIRTF